MIAPIVPPHSLQELVLEQIQILRTPCPRMPLYSTVFLSGFAFLVLC
jgi:hypothetical protein